MKNILIILCLICLCGCAPLANQEGMNQVINEYREEIARGKTTIVDAPYKETFLAVDSVIKEYKILILKEDFDNRVILCNLDRLSYRLYTPLLIFFEELGNNNTKIIVTGPGLAYCPYLIQRFKDELNLRKQTK